LNNDIDIRFGSSSDEPDQRNSTTQVEAGNSSSVYGPFEAVGCCVRVRFGQAAQHSPVSQSGSFTSIIHSKDGRSASRLSVYFQAAQKGMR
jgi:hypothetical protein